MMGKAIPIKEKKGVLSGDTYHAGNDRKRRKMDIIEIAETIAFIIFSTIVNDNSSIFYPHQKAGVFLRLSDSCIQNDLVSQVSHHFFFIPDAFCS